MGKRNTSTFYKEIENSLGSLRRLLGMPKHNSASGMFVQLNIKLFGELLRSYIDSFMNRLQCSNNLILSSIM